MPSASHRAGTDDTGEPAIRRVSSARDKELLLRLRDLVYVQDQGRIDAPEDLTESFDLFDAKAVHLLAEQDGEPVGTIKVVPDSELGLPCEQMVTLDGYRPGRRLVEFGHLMTIPRVRSRRIGMDLMREALLLARSDFGATHVVGDFFAEDTGDGLRGFYTALGFTPLAPVYRDARFKDAPPSVVGALDLAAAARRQADRAGAPRELALLDFFFHDYDRRAHTAAPR